MIVLGIDEAGRGAVVGPLVMYGTVLRPDQETYLKSINVRDSKQYTSSLTRDDHARVTKELCTYGFSHAPASSIIQQQGRGSTLDDIERHMACQIITTILRDYQVPVDTIIIDGQMFESLIPWVAKHFPSQPKVIVRNKADQDFISVAAASVCAKSERDYLVRRIMGNYFDKGAGYPNSGTEKWVREILYNTKMFDLEGKRKQIRTTWSWWTKLQEKLNNEQA